MFLSQPMASIFLLLVIGREFILECLKSVLKSFMANEKIDSVKASPDVSNKVSINIGEDMKKCSNNLSKLEKPKLVKKRVKKINIVVVNPSLFPDENNNILIEQHLQKKIEEKRRKFEQTIYAEKLRRWKQISGTGNSNTGKRRNLNPTIYIMTYL